MLYLRFKPTGLIWNHIVFLSSFANAFPSIFIEAFTALQELMVVFICAGGKSITKLYYYLLSTNLIISLKHLSS